MTIQEACYRASSGHRPLTPGRKYKYGTLEAGNPYSCQSDALDLLVQEFPQSFISAVEWLRSNTKPPAGSSYS